MSEREGISQDVSIGSPARSGPTLAELGINRRNLWWWVAQHTLNFLLRAGWGLQVDGFEHLPPAGPYLICGNHPSEIDPVVLGAALPFRPTFVAGHELERYPVIFWLLQRFDPVLVRRGMPDIGAVRACLARLEAGDVVVIYPEGGVVQDRLLGTLHPGAAFLALRTRVPVVPAAIFGVAQVWPLGARFPRGGKITIRFGLPLHPKDGERPADLTKRIEAALLDLLQKRTGEQANRRTGEPANRRTGGQGTASRRPGR
ncbi:MAG TPA: lysophospholipid acyltransferase family protein [bacterium]|jgi:1-acyl-sn-glycerol-3-phosphate acyltransferase